MQHFASQLRPGQQTTRSLRASQYKQSIKRKRDGDSEEPPDNLDNGAGPSHAQTPGLSDPLLAAQLRVAGLLPDDDFEPPPPPFPHGPANKPRDHFTQTKIHQELAGLQPAIYVADATSSSHRVGEPSREPALRKTHLDILSAVMHRCLFEGDYDRAAKAWGMILRTRVTGRQLVDPRNHGRWGIGAEMLLRRKFTGQANDIPDEDHGKRKPGDERHPSGETEPFSEEGFELARDYYERLIVQYPHRKLAPHAVDSRAFYPPFFCIWIREVLAQSERTRKLYRGELGLSSSSSASSRAGSPGPKTLALETAIRANELDRAREIRERLDQLIVSPPFDKHTELLRLRGSVGLWISDLTLSPGIPNREDWEMDISDYDAVNSAASTVEALRGYAGSIEELERAREFFSRAEENGEKDLGWTMSSIEVKMNQLTKQMAQMRQ